MSNELIPTVNKYIINGLTSNLNELFNQHPSLLNERPAGWSWLHIASKRGGINVVKLLIELGLDIDARDDFSQTPLTGAISHNKIKIAKYLLQNGADVDAKIDNSKTNLMIAIQEGSIEAVELLVENGADLQATYLREDGKTISPLILAKEYGWKQIIDYLITSGAED